MSAVNSPAFLDTSYIVRYLTNDPPTMAEIAATVIDSNRPLLISTVILVESAYVLSSVYQIPWSDLVDALMSLLQRHNIQMYTLSKTAALEALRLCRNSNRHSFADALLWAEVRASASPQLYTFDRRFPKEEITLLEEG